MSPTVAVLPLRIVDPDTSIALATAVAADLADRLGHLRGLQSIPRGEVVDIAGSSDSPQVLARELGAQILVSGDIAQSAGAIRIELTVERFGDLPGRARVAVAGSSEALLDLEGELVLRVAAALAIEPLRRELESLARDPTRSIKAWQYAAQGRLYLEDRANPRAPHFAADLFRLAVNLDPDYNQARAGLAEALWLQSLGGDGSGSLAAAEEQARIASAASPHSEAVAVTRALIRLWRKRPDRPMWQQDLDLGPLPKPDQAMRRLADSLRRVGELGMAEAAWGEAVDLGSTHWLNWYGLARFFDRGGRLAEAEQAYRRADTLAPRELLWPRVALLRLQLATGASQAAVATWDRLDSLQGFDVDLLAALADALLAENRWADAEAVLLQASVAELTDPALEQRLGTALMWLDRRQEARAHFLSALEDADRRLADRPDDLDLRLSVALLTAQSDLCDRALPMALTVERSQPRTATRLRDLARIFALCDEGERATKALGEALRQGLPPRSLAGDWALRSLLLGSDRHD